jgi:hypothetical protein
MLKMRNVTLLVGAALVLVCAGAAVQAEPTLNTTNVEYSGRYKTVVLPQSAPLSITQNVDPATVEQVNVACSNGGISTENAWLRLFDLDDDHGAVGQFCVKNLDYAVEIATGAPDLNVRTYCLNEGLPFLYAFMTLVDDVAVSQADTALEFFNVEVNGCCDSATQDLAVEVFAEDCLTNGTCLQFWLGANDNGQTAPSYIASASCGILDPTDMALIGFPSIAVVYTVNGNDESVDGDGDGDGDVPAVTGIGMLLMVLIVLGSTAFFAVRRRVTN